MKNQINKQNNNTKKGLRVYTILSSIFGVSMLFIPKVFAADNDPITVVTNLSDFIFQLITIIGGIVVGYGIVQIGMSFTSHDASQRANGFMFFAGGVIIMCAKTILKLIAG